MQLPAHWPWPRPWPQPFLMPEPSQVLFSESLQSLAPCPAHAPQASAHSPASLQDALFTALQLAASLQSAAQDSLSRVPPNELAPNPEANVPLSARKLWARSLGRRRPPTTMSATAASPMNSWFVEFNSVTSSPLDRDQTVHSGGRHRVGQL